MLETDVLTDEVTVCDADVLTEVLADNDTVVVPEVVTVDDSDVDCVRLLVLLTDEVAEVL